MLFFVIIFRNNIDYGYERIIETAELSAQTEAIYLFLPLTKKNITASTPVFSASYCQQPIPTKVFYWKTAKSHKPFR
ncbi:MAG: hypothetical protein BGO33_14425 [Bacteroidia bacterium 43-41]|nr:MAG: hypothetical protein BGO33_14425 [Bacteroidia bacterium 43-41]